MITAASGAGGEGAGAHVVLMRFAIDHCALSLLPLPVEVPLSELFAERSFVFVSPNRILAPR